MQFANFMKTFAMALDCARGLIYNDAVAHGLWDKELIPDPEWAVYRLEDEVGELSEESIKLKNDPKNDEIKKRFGEELADVVIMALSIAGRYNIEIGEEVIRKMEQNQRRAWRHKDDTD